MNDVVKEYENSVFSVLRIVKAVAPHMVARKRGTIINIGSLAGQVSVYANLESRAVADRTFLPSSAPFGGLFASTKSALHMLTDTLDMELRPFGIHVTLVVTGLTRTSLNNEAQARLVSAVGGQSLYTGFLDSMSVRVALSQWTKAMPADEMARQIVKQLLSSPPPRTLYAGSMTRRMRLLTFLPRTLVLTFLWFYMIRLPSLLASIGLI
jgi:1-acylglycerone phosphate reductase